MAKATSKYSTEKELLYMAAASQYGIVVATMDMQRDVSALNMAKRQEQEFLPRMEIRRSPWDPNNELWIVKIKEAPPQAGEEFEAPPPAITINDLSDLDL